MLEQLGVELDARGQRRPRRGVHDQRVDGVFACGDMGRGQSLIVWAIAEGRSCAAGVDAVADGRDDAPGADPPDDAPPQLNGGIAQ